LDEFLVFKGGFLNGNSGRWTSTVFFKRVQLDSSVFRTWDSGLQSDTGFGFFWTWTSNGFFKDLFCWLFQGSDSGRFSLDLIGLLVSLRIDLKKEVD